jgi:hypothetical protein
MTADPQLALFAEDDLLPDDVLSMVPVCSWCGLPGPTISTADLPTFGRKYQHGDPWWPVIAWGLIALDEHQRSCGQRPGATR